MKRDFGLDNLLELDGYESHYPNGYWYKINARLVDVTQSIPHGIQYSLTFHDDCNNRLFGMDNKHVPKNKRKGYHGRIIKFDHVHNDKNDKGTAYAFLNAEKLMNNFWERVDSIFR